MSLEAFRRVERDAWEKGAYGYWDSFGAIFQPVSAELMDRLALSTGDQVLDVASGPGWVAGAAAARGAHVLGVDISRSMVDLAARLYPAVRFVQADAEALPFGQSRFDLSVSNLGLSHVARPIRMVAEMVRVTRQGGRVVVTSHDEPDATALVGLVNEAVMDAGVERPPSLPQGPSIFHHGFPGNDIFASLLEAVGLQDVMVSRISFCYRTTTAELWNILSRGSTSVALLLEGQSLTSRRKLKTAFVRLAMRYGTPDQLEVPISIKFAVGTQG